MHPRAWFRTPGSRRPGGAGRPGGRAAALTTAVTSVTALALFAGLAVQPQLAPELAGAHSSDRPDDWYETTGDEQLRFDQCLMTDALRLGGTDMYAFAQNALNQTPEKLRELATLDGAYNGPLHDAYNRDQAATDANWQRLHAREAAWEKPLDGLPDPGGFTHTGFHWVRGGEEGSDFYDQTGLGKWASPDWNDKFDFYDPTPEADAKTLKAVDDLGTPLYGQDPDPGLPSDQWNRALNERDAFKWLHGFATEKAGADNARVFLASGGWPRTAPEPGSTEYRIAVEDLKTRFATCAWRDPIDPNKTLRQAEDTAAQEWQQEIASQATQRNQILGASRDATSALTKGAETMAEMLAQSWIADHLTRWQDYWSAGGFGWIGDGQLEIQVPGASGKCLDVAGGAKTNGTPVQIYTCNSGAAQKWQLWGSENGGYRLMNPNAGTKCLDVAGSSGAEGAKIQIRDCASTKTQFWAFDVRSPGALRNTVTGKCLHLPGFDNSRDAVQSTCNGSSAQTFRVVPKTHTGDGTLSYPKKAQFDQAKAGIAAAQTAAKAQLAVLKTQLTTAQKAATASDTALQAAYGIADANGAPRGRGLLVGQQKDQVTKGAAAALQALEKAGETAEAATRASAGDSATIAQRALAQAAQSKAEFRKKAAEAAEAQAKAAADAAKVHRDNAKKDKETAEAKLAVAVRAEADAKAAAADAHAKRLAAEAEEKTAKAEKENAAAERAEAAGHRKNAESEATKAKDAKARAEAAEKTAEDRRDDAVKAKDHAAAMRDDALDAEQKAQAARAKAAAKQAYADSLDSGSAADAARAAADDADKAAGDAEAAATRARSEADAATKAAADADAAATRAEAAAKRARSDADAAQADKLKADAAVRTATSAVADAIQASKDASAQAKASVELADEAQAHAKDAKAQADAANKEAVTAVAAAAKAAGFAHVTAQAAVDAGKAAAQVADPANDAVQLGSPYVDTDSAAALVVLTGQGSKTIAEQQQAVADAHAKNAAAEAQAAKNTADQAKGDAKEAYTHAAGAAQYAADARTYSKEALGYAADAAKAAAAASASLTRTIGYDNQAAEDAAAADAAAGRAEGYAKDARDSADAAELDAAAARSAAAQAEQDAKDARAAADRADTAATEAEQAAKDAARYAEEAQAAADRAEKAAQAQQIGAGTVPDGDGGSIGNVFYVVDHIEKVGDPQVVSKTDGCDGWIDKLFYRGDCTITSKIRYVAVLDLYLCGAQDLDPQKYSCPSEATDYIGQIRTKELSQTVTHTITMEEYQSNIDPVDILFGSWIKCAQKLTPGGQSGSWGGCAWAAVDVASMFAGKAVRPIADALRAVDAAFVTGVGVRDALKALKAIDGIDAVTVAAIEREVSIYEELVTACKVNSFPGTTEVVLADGGRKALRDVHAGDLLLATDPATGRTRGEPVTRTFRHGADDLVDVTLADGGRLTSTPGHRFFVPGRGWTLASDLRPGDVLRTPGGTRAVSTVAERHEATPRTVYDLTVSGLHTFYAVAGDSPVLVHNCNDLAADAQKFSGQAHTLDEHTAGIVSPQRAVELAAEKTRRYNRTTPNSLFVDQQTAQQVVDYALANNANRIKNWLQKTTRPDLDFEGSFGARNSLGKAYYPDGSAVATGNRFYIKLVRAKGHKAGFYVQTCYPK
ncbi:ricin-type beta-trefoil lectin domain protein [Streptomyces sp. 16-176A]|uniref:ricin-type beta-trefoil lectin domain protein n=1 Tax=Streptomyces sp. 16-176A TaxID=2530458 RepID=UPI00345D0248